MNYARDKGIAKIIIVVSIMVFAILAIAFIAEAHPPEPPYQCEGPSPCLGHETHTPEPTNTPTVTNTPTSTNTPTPTNTPTNTPTPTPEPCNFISIEPDAAVSDEMQWTIINDMATTITIESIYIDWPSQYDLEGLTLDGAGNIMWEGSDSDPPSTFTDLNGDRDVLGGTEGEFSAWFDATNGTGIGYSLQIGFSNDCTIQASYRPEEDTTAPVVLDGGTLVPTPYTVDGCSIDVTVDDAIISDASPSSGMKDVEVFYKVTNYDRTVSYTPYMSSLPLVSDDAAMQLNGSWLGTYSLASPFNISIYDGFSYEEDNTEEDPFRIRFFLNPMDNAIRQQYYEYGAYFMPTYCDDPE